MVRKHVGIVQNGTNKGRLKPGYRYNGKKTSTGLPVIVNCACKKSTGNKSKTKLKSNKGGSFMKRKHRRNSAKEKRRLLEEERALIAKDFIQKETNLLKERFNCETKCKKSIKKCRKRCFGTKCAKPCQKNCYPCKEQYVQKLEHHRKYGRLVPNSSMSL